MWWSVLAVAAASSDGFEPVRTAHDCAISMRPESHPSGAAMRAECTWPELDYDEMVDQLGHFDQYSAYVFAIDESRVERTEGPRSLVYQRQVVFGISDREVLLWMEQQPHGDGVRYAWTTAADEPLEVDPGSVRVPRNEGFWQIEPAADGGVQVVHEIAMDAGGAIPRWLVSLVRNRSFAKVMGDVRRVVAERADESS